MKIICSITYWTTYFVIGIPFLLKISEVAYNIIWDIFQAKHPRPLQQSDLYITRLLFLSDNGLMKFIRNEYYRWPTLIVAYCLVAIVGANSSDYHLQWINIIVIFVGLWLTAIHNTITPLAWPYSETYNFRSVSVVIERNHESQLTKRGMVKKYIKCTFFIFSIAIFAYATMYYMICKCGDYSSFFIGNIGKMPIFAELLYFSSMTIITIGYGDISPINLWTRILAQTESYLHILFIFGIATSYGLTMNVTKKRNRDNT